MPILQFTGKQYLLTLPKEDIEQLGWEKGTDLYVTKDPELNILIIVEKKKGIRQ